ncbi:TraR/DksA C4-type zinc finger protein [Pseudomonas sp. BIC9C]|uniref:TraR/DksA C4-type zinc finger protein n=1 Tax=Pseudomonas sp. BIC9C TaxID=3078458 RepID=UPI002AD44218|nr:TraR/DksA C4-type zinc finger protein [Pseudomonas sp. BIC9C]
MRSSPRFVCRCFVGFRGCWVCSTAPRMSTRQRGVLTVADWADMAGEILERSDEAFAARKPAPVAESLKSCIDCDEPISPARRMASRGCKRCTECEEIKAKQGAHYAR